MGFRSRPAPQPRHCGASFALTPAFSPLVALRGRKGFGNLILRNSISYYRLPTPLCRLPVARQGPHQRFPTRSGDGTGRTGRGTGRGRTSCGSGLGGGLVPTGGGCGVVPPATGEVVLVPFPFSDLSQSKVRPAVCLADAGRGDWVLRQITSSPYGGPSAVPLDAGDFASAGLLAASLARPGKLFTAHAGLIVRSVGVLTPTAFGRVLTAVMGVFQPPASS